MREAMASNLRATQRASIKLADTIQPAKEAATRLSKRVGRFEIYDFLIAVYRVYAGWKDHKVARRSARLLARELSITRRKGASPTLYSRARTQRPASGDVQEAIGMTKPRPRIIRE